MSRRATLYDQRPPVVAPVTTRSREYEEVDSYLKRPEWRSRPAFLEKDYEKHNQGSMVVKEREAETSSRRFDRNSRPGSPIRAPSQSRPREPSLPPIERFHARVVEREKVRERSIPAPSERLLARIVDPRERVQDNSLSSTSTHVDRREKHERKERRRSPTPPPIESVHNRKVERHESHQASQVSSSSPPTPPPIHAPPIHQEIITHHRHINHGFESAKPLTPPPSSRREVVLRESEEDMHTSHYDPSPNFSRRETSETVTLTRRPRSRQRHHNDDSPRYESENRKPSSQEIRIELSQRRSKSAHPGRHQDIVRIEIRDDEDEADYYARKTDERATIGEAKNGVTKDWATIDVPPGTERVVLDGVGGASQEITWQKYNGVRRSKFIPDREQIDSRELSPPNRENIRKRLEFREDPEYRTTNLDIGISHSQNRRRNGAPVYDHEYEREYERVEDDIEWHDSVTRQPRQRNNDLWTEITKDLVTKEAILEMGYDFEETDNFYYILQYLQYEDVVDLVKLSDQIRYERQQRLREIEWERRQLEMREME